MRTRRRPRDDEWHVIARDIEAARRVIAGQVLRTPMLPAPKLSALTGAEVFVKYENLQVTNSFKERGALNKLASLSPAERARGVIAMSAGNHAQAVAYHAQRLGIPATIVMPVTTPFVKIEATQAYGAEVVLEGETIAEAQVRAEAIAARARSHLRAPLRRRAGDRRAGHHRARNARRGARPRPAGHSDRRRRADRRQRDRGARQAARHRDRRRRGGALSVVLERAARRASAARRADAGGRHRGQERRHAHAADRARARRRDRAGRRGAPRTGGQRLPDPAEDDGGGRRRRRAGGHAGQARALSSAARSGSSCAAATSIRAFSRRSWCASSSARTASSRSA